MNATEQIALLRRACEIMRDWWCEGHRISSPAFKAKWGGIGSDGVQKEILAALSATATPPEDNVARLTKERDEVSEELGIEMADRVKAESERDDALAKLAAAQKELADIYAAKTEPGKPIVTEDNEGYLWIGCGIYARELRKVATGVTTADAQRIADALNGGKP